MDWRERETCELERKLPRSRNKLQVKTTNGEILYDSVLPASFSNSRCRIDLLDAPEIANFAQH